MAKARKNNNTEEPIEKQLWKSADKLRKNIDAAKYKHIVMGLIFLKYISDAFEELFAKLKKGEGEYAGADPEDKDEYKAENVFFVPETARWSYLQSKAKLPDIGKEVDNAMDAIEKDKKIPGGAFLLSLVREFNVNMKLFWVQARLNLYPEEFLHKKKEPQTALNYLI